MLKTSKKTTNVINFYKKQLLTTLRSLYKFTLITITYTSYTTPTALNYSSCRTF